MRIWVDVPEPLAEPLRALARDPSAAALEALAIDLYRRDQFTAHQLGEVLGIPSRAALDGLLKAHGVSLEYTIDEFEAERETTDRHWSR